MALFVPVKFEMVINLAVKITLVVMISFINTELVAKMPSKYVQGFLPS